MQALERMGLGERSWIDTDASKKYGVDSEVNRYLVRLLPHLQRFCEIDVQGPVYQDSLFLCQCQRTVRIQKKAKNAFDNAKGSFLKVTAA